MRLFDDCYWSAVAMRARMAANLLAVALALAAALGPYRIWYRQMIPWWIYGHRAAEQSITLISHRGRQMQFSNGDKIRDDALLLLNVLYVTVSGLTLSALLLAARVTVGRLNLPGSQPARDVTLAKPHDVMSDPGVDPCAPHVLSYQAPEPPPGLYARQWRSYERRKAAVLLTFMGGAFAAGALSSLLLHLTAWRIIQALPFVIWIAALIATILRAALWPCPRCGRPYFYRPGHKGAFASSCVHCGLPNMAGT